MPWTYLFYKPTLIKYYEHRMLSLSVQGKWKTSSNWNTLLDPLNGEPFIKVAEVDETGIQVCIMSSLQVLYFWKDLPHYWVYIEAELKSLCFIMPSFHFPSLISSIILSLKWLAFFLFFFFGLHLWHAYLCLHIYHLNSFPIVIGLCSHLWRACPSVPNMVYTIPLKHQRGLCCLFGLCVLLFS